MGAALILHETARIVHLQTEEVAEAVGEEDVGHPGVDHLVHRHIHQLGRLQQARQLVVHLQMQLAVATTRFDLLDDLLLLLVEGCNQIGKLTAPPRPGAGDVGGITMKIDAGIDQEGVALRIRHPHGRQMSVVKDGRIAVDGDDIAVGRLIGPLPDRFHIGQIDLELARPRHKGVLGGNMAAYPDPVRLAQTLQLVGGFVGAVIVQVVEYRLRIGLGQSQQIGHFQMPPQIGPLLLVGR